MGSGGKTSLMFRLAHEVLSQGRKVVTTTTTKIFYPTPDQSTRVILESDPERLVHLTADAIKTRAHITIAHQTNHQNKLIGIDPGLADQLFQTGLFDLMAVEADGARGLGLKAPGSEEPVIPQAAGLVVAVVGLGTMGRPLTEDHVFRSERFADLAELPLGGVIEPVHVARVLRHPMGHFKNTPAASQKVVMLNQADLVDPQWAAEAARVILETGRPVLDRVVWGSLQKMDREFSVIVR